MVTPSTMSTFGSATAAATVVPGTFKYDSNNPETLIGAKVEVTWKRNRKYLGKIETYEVDGQHKGKHKCIYDDGDIKYYKIKVMRKGDRTKLVNQHYKDSTTGTGVITVKKWKNSGAAVVPPPPVAGLEEIPHIIVIERTIESKISSFFNDSSNSSNDNSNDNSKTPDNTIPLTLKYTGHTYKLDSAIVRDIGKKHFAAFITLNKKQYGFDGNQYSRLQQMNWKDMLNDTDKYIVWDVDGETPQEEIENTHALPDFDEMWRLSTYFSFQEGYQQLFYYRVE